MSNTARETRIRGVVYPSRSAAARALGVSVAAVSRAARRGRLDCAGLPRAAMTATRDAVVTLDGRVAGDLREVAEAYGVAPWRMREALARLRRIRDRSRGAPIG